MPRINLLPWREAERKRKRQEFFLSLGAAVATAGLVTLLGYWQMTAAIQHQQDRNDLLTREIAALDKQIEEINGLDAQKRRLLARMEIIETLQRSRPEIVHIFDEVVRVLPEGVYLTYLRQTGTRFEVRHRGGHVNVAVLDGMVQVVGSSGEQGEILRKGQTVTVSNTIDVPPPSAVDKIPTEVMYGKLIFSWSAPGAAIATPMPVSGSYFPSVVKYEAVSAGIGA